MTAERVLREGEPPLSSLVIPVGGEFTFRRLRELNRECSIEQLADAFAQLPDALREEAWVLRLREQLDRGIEP